MAHNECVKLTSPPELGGVLPRSGREVVCNFSEICVFCLTQRRKECKSAHASLVHSTADVGAGTEIGPYIQIIHPDIFQRTNVTNFSPGVS